MHRATPGGTGGVKTIGNYAAVSLFIATTFLIYLFNYIVDIKLNNVWHYVNIMQVLKAQGAAKAKGYSDVLYLDSTHKKYLEEVSSCNIFVVKVYPKVNHLISLFVNEIVISFLWHPF